MEVNSLLLGDGSNNSRASSDQKVLHAFMLGGHEDENHTKELITLKVWNMLTPEARIAMRSGEAVNIELVKDSGAKEFKRGG